MYKSFYGHVHPFFLGMYLRAELLGHLIAICVVVPGRCLLLVLAETDKIFRRVFTELCGWKLARLVVDTET